MEIHGNSAYPHQDVQAISDSCIPSLPLLLQERYVLAVNLTVTKISGVGEDSVFMGIIEVGERVEG
jgi:hypothetical protein